MMHYSRDIDGLMSNPKLADHSGFEAKNAPAIYASDNVESNLQSLGMDEEQLLDMARAVLRPGDANKGYVRIVPKEGAVIRDLGQDAQTAQRIDDAWQTSTEDWAARRGQIENADAVVHEGMDLSPEYLIRNPEAFNFFSKQRMRALAPLLPLGVAEREQR
jgi:hypothetical protein